jgi:hypothetical protein
MPNELAPKYSFLDYLFLQTVAAGYWVSVHTAIDFIFINQNGRYLKKSSVESYEYRSNILGVFHAILATLISFYCIFYACGEGNNFFNSEECAKNPRNITIFAAIFSGSYFLVDLILLVYYTKCETAMHK